MTSMPTDSNIHISVLPNECVDSLSPAFENIKNPKMIDCTLGGAGHTKLFLDKFKILNILSFDLDLNAIEKAKINLKNDFEKKRLSFHHGNFIEALSLNVKTCELCPPPWNAALLDLGYSSNQLENPEYGMSFMPKTDSEIDMRLSRPPKGGSAWDLLCESTETELAEILEAYGEVRGARKLSQKIKEALQQEKITNSVISLAKFIEKNTYHKEKIHPATLVFQALRIAVNDELRNIDTFLKGIGSQIIIGGRVAIISFHSLEDRIVKRWGQNNTEFKAIQNKPITATDEEIRFNPRSRSAKLRVYERV